MVDALVRVCGTLTQSQGDQRLSLLLWGAGQYSRPIQQQSEDVFALASPLYHQIFYIPQIISLSAAAEQ